MQALSYNVVLELVCASFVVYSSTGTCLCKLCSIQRYWNDFVQAFQYTVVLGSALCKLCNIQQYWERVCASFVVHSSTGKCFVQAL